MYIYVIKSSEKEYNQTAKSPFSPVLILIA